MKKLGRVAALLMLGLLAGYLLAQTPVKAPQVPTLSLAEGVALNSLDKTKQEAAKQWQEANAEELAILREWQTAHPGWHIDATTFKITPEGAGKK